MGKKRERISLLKISKDQCPSFYSYYASLFDFKEFMFFNSLKKGYNVPQVEVVTAFE